MVNCQFWVAGRGLGLIVRLRLPFGSVVFRMSGQRLRSCVLTLLSHMISHYTCPALTSRRRRLALFACECIKHMSADGMKWPVSFPPHTQARVTKWRKWGHASDDIFGLFLNPQLPLQLHPKIALICYDKKLNTGWFTFTIQYLSCFLCVFFFYIILLFELSKHQLCSFSYQRSASDGQSVMTAIKTENYYI